MAPLAMARTKRMATGKPFKLTEMPSEFLCHGFLGNKNSEKNRSLQGRQGSGKLEKSMIISISEECGHSWLAQP